jgi:hypothetical protein
MSTFNIPKFLPGDAVSYTGSKFKHLNGKKGWIHWPVQGVSDCFVIEFPDTKDKEKREDTDDYVMHANVLSPWHPSEKEKIKQEGPEVQPRRRRKKDDEETE